MNILILNIFCWLGTIFIYCSAQNNQNLCNYKATCHECIQQKDCVWCIGQNTTTIHCLDITEKEKCLNNNLENPKSEILSKENDEDSFIRPSKFDLKLRPQHPQKIEFNFTQPKNLPVDLYFLMDISYSMRVHRDELVFLAVELVSKIKNYTSDVRMGFGSFVDKPISPFAYTDDGIIKNPCPELGCAVPYSFQNHVPLTTDIDEFLNKVNTTQLSGNIDTPEGSLEALMQAVVCKSQIGWRKNARHIVVLSTDAMFHIAGDGRLAGIDKPNDGLCHLKNNIYTHSLLQDYPSIGQITEKVKENNVIVVFAVTEAAREIFQQLKDRIPSSYIGILSEHATIVNILNNIFVNITNTVKIEHNFGPNFDITFASNCSGFNKRNVTCIVKPDEKISFTAKIELNQCPLDNNLNNTYKMYPTGLNKDISIKINFACKCSCEHEGEQNSPTCSGVGTLQCGTCTCPSDKIGNFCECDTIPNLRNAISSENCIKENTSEPCSGVGVCNCGQCICDDRRTEEKYKIYGTFCECNDGPCYDDNDIVCSEHGTCSCGVCQCNAGWSGKKCDCAKSVDSCIAPNSNVVCSGSVYGKCVCGKCKCNDVHGYKYSGDYCDVCLTCPQCSQYKSCIECKVFKQGIYDQDECDENCALYKIELFDDVDQIGAGETCSIHDSKDCVIKYKYVFDINENSTVLYAQKEKLDCTEVASIGLWAGIPILSLLVATLIALAVFKVFSVFQYRAEYAEFLKKRSLERQELNPLYKSPNSTVMNPLYGQN